MFKCCCQWYQHDTVGQRRCFLLIWRGCGKEADASAKSEDIDIAARQLSLAGVSCCKAHRHTQGSSGAEGSTGTSGVLPLTVIPRQLRQIRARAYHQSLRLNEIYLDLVPTAPHLSSFPSYNRLTAASSSQVFVSIAAMVSIDSAREPVGSNG